MRGIHAAAGGLARVVWLTAAACFGMAGCAGNGNGLDANGQPIAPGGAEGGGPLTDDFGSIQANIFTPICSVCHVGGGAPQGLRLDAADSYDLLVGVPSTEVPGVLRVKPGDPDNSYLIQKLEGHAAVGAQMPFGGPYLTESTIAFVRQWITNGAQPSPAVPASAPAATADAVAAGAGAAVEKAGMTAASAKAGVTAAEPLSLTVRAPEMNEFVSEPPPQIMLGFNREIDAAALDPDSVRIERLSGGPEQPLLEGIPVHISVSAANLKVLMVWPSRPLTPGRYRVVLRAGSSLGIEDLAGHPVGPGGAAGAEDSLATVFEVETLQ